VVFIQVLIRKNRFNTAWNWSLYRSGHVHLAINKKNGRTHNWHCFYSIHVSDQKQERNTCPRQPPLNSIELNRLYFSNWCMVTESIMKWVFWYLSYIMSSYKYWNVECVWDNHPFILHLLVVFYILEYWLILDVFDIGCILHISILVNKGIMEWVFWY
jgi:hypothetical protein